MSRKRRAPKRKLINDPKYGSPVISKLINKMMYGGKKTTAEKIIYDALDKIKEKSYAQIPMGRYGTIEEFGRTGAFLLSDAASYITGSSLAVDGGVLKTVW